MGIWALCVFACQQRVLKTSPGHDCLHSEDGVVWLWHSLVNLYIWLTISFCYDSIPLTLGLIERDDGLSTLCHSCGFAFQQRVLKTFPGPGCLRSEDGLVWLWHSLVNLYIYIYYIYIYMFIFIYVYIYIYTAWNFELFCRKKKKQIKNFLTPFYLLGSNTSRLQSDYGKTIYTFEH